MDVEEAFAPAEKRRFCEISDVMQKLLKLKRWECRIHRKLQPRILWRCVGFSWRGEAVILLLVQPHIAVFFSKQWSSGGVEERRYHFRQWCRRRNQCYHLTWLPVEELPWKHRWSRHWWEFETCRRFQEAWQLDALNINHLRIEHINVIVSAMIVVKHHAGLHIILNAACCWSEKAAQSKQKARQAAAKEGWTG